MPELALLLFWPAIIGYSEAAVAYVGDTIRPGRLARFGVWGVRLGWLAQTGLLVAQAAAEGFVWATWAGSLNLFVWMCVTTYLVWGCRAPYRLLGLAVMPLAAIMFGVAWAFRTEEPTTPGRFGTAFLAAHVGLVLAAFAAFTLAAALGAVYLWQEGRLKRHSPTLLRVRAPSLSTLDALIGRTLSFGLPALTIGMAVGLARLADRTGGIDAVMATTLVAWCVYAALLVLRHEVGWRGRRAAVAAIAGFALVVAVRIVAIPVGHA
jgi:ABC-type uncharacterized transport system permease subunit